MIHRQQQKHDSYCDIGEAAQGNEKNVKYYTDTQRPTRLQPGIKVAMTINTSLTSLFCTPFLKTAPEANCEKKVKRLMP